MAKTENGENNGQVLSPEQQLREAITAGKIFQVNKLIRAGANVDYIGDDGRTLTHIALQEGKIRLANRLIDAGAKTNIKSAQDDDKTAAELLLEMLRKSIVCDADIESTTSESIFAVAKQVISLDYVDAEGQTFLSSALQHGNITLAKRLIDEGAQKVPLPCGTTIDELITDTLHKEIVAHGKYVKIIDLIDMATDLNHIDKDGWTFLHLALRQHDIVLAHTLIEKGASKEVVSKNDEAVTPIDLMNLALSTVKDPSKIVMLKLMGADMNSVNSKGWTPLHIALIDGNIELAVQLFNCDAKPVQSQNSAKQTPADIINKQTLIHKAILDTKSDISSLMRLVDMGAEVNLLDENGWTPLHLSLKENKIELVKVLIQKGADKEIVSKNDAAITPLTLLGLMLCKAISENKPIKEITEWIRLGADVNSVDQDGWAPLHLALKKENMGIVDLLIQNGAKKDVVSQNSELKTPADIINDKGYLNKLVLVDLSIKEIELLVRLDSDVNGVDQDGWTPLHLTLRQENLMVAKLLIDAGANAHQNSLNQENQTAADLMNQLLCKAIVKSHSRSVITELIDMGADVNSLGQDGWAPLHLSLQKGDIARSKVLLAHGADVSIASRNDAHTTPEEIAREMQLDLSSIATHNPPNNLKESLILFKGPDTEHFKTFTDNPKHNLFHPSSLGQHFALQEFNNFDAMLGAIQSLSSTGSKINLVIDAHGMPTTPYTMTTTHHFDKKASDVLDSIIKATDGRPIKLLVTSCFGERIHTCDSELAAKMPNGSMIITLSKEDRTTISPDYCHNNIPHILDSLLISNEGSCLKLEQLLEAYCLTQRFCKNTPKISLFNGAKQKTISLKEYFNNNILKANDLVISKTMSELLDIMGSSKEDFDSMLREISSAPDAKTQKSLWRIPNSLSDIKNIFQYLTGDRYSELLELYKSYFVNNDAIETLPSEEATKSVYSIYEPKSFDDDFYHNTVKHGSPLRICISSRTHNYDKIDATPKHSMFLAVAADHLIAEIGAGSFCSEWERD